MAIRSASLDDLMELVRGATRAQPTSELEASLKQQIRKVGGKAAEFVPYLVHEISEQIVGAQALELPRKPTLAAAVAAAEQMLGSQAPAVAQRALARYIEENDVSYKLKPLNSRN